MFFREVTFKLKRVGESEREGQHWDEPFQRRRGAQSHLLDFFELQCRGWGWYYEMELKMGAEAASGKAWSSRGRVLILF